MCTTSSPRQEEIFFWPAFVTRILTPWSRKSGYGLLFGRCRSQLAAGPFENTFFMTMFEKRIGQNPRENLHCLFWSGIAIDRAWSTSSGGSPWCSRKSRTACDKIVPNFSPPKNCGKTQYLKTSRKFHARQNWILAHEFSTFLSRIACCARESTSAWQNLPQK